jgi:mannonate dehydratase
MRLALALDPLQDADLLFAQQLGVEHVFIEPTSLGRVPVAAIANRVRQAGLRLEGIASLPWQMYGSAVTELPALAAAQECLAHVCALIREAGQAGVGQIGYGWGIPARSAVWLNGRGGAASRVYRWDQPDENDRPTLGREQLWANLARFLQQVLPEAEQAGVRLACQPGHPAMGLARPRILDTLEDIEHLFSLAPSPHHGLDLDHGFFALAPNQDPCDTIRRLSRDGRLFSVRLRALQPRDGDYGESFLDQDREGLLRALECYRDNSFQGTLRPAPVPALAEDTFWGHKGYAFSVGYLRALLQACGA